MFVDTGPLVAALNRRDPQHQACRKLLDSRAGELQVTPYVVAEVCWMVSSRIGAVAEANVIDAVAAGNSGRSCWPTRSCTESLNYCTSMPICTEGRA